MVKAELHSIASALVGGAKYGVKIRLPHALVMTFLFRRDLSSKDKLRNVLFLAFQHASSLAAFATIYKVILALLKLASRKLIVLGTDDTAQNIVWVTLGKKIMTMIGKKWFSAPTLSLAGSSVVLFPIYTTRLTRLF
jgi:predicted MPP superfamily phosphohydrolase